VQVYFKFLTNTSNKTMLTNYNINSCKDTRFYRHLVFKTFGFKDNWFLNSWFLKHLVFMTFGFRTFGSNLVVNDDFDHPVPVATIWFATFSKKVTQPFVGSDSRLGRHFSLKKNRKSIQNLIWSNQI
jgi:hypothetical protein